MVLHILIAWIALGAVAVLFMYCCSRVSNGPREVLDDDDFSTGPIGPGRIEARDFTVLSAQAAERYPGLQ